MVNVHLPKILVIGDVHGSFRRKLNPLINRFQSNIILAAGDFGYWPNLSGAPSDPGKEIKNRLRKGNLCEIRWCDGNHEDHVALHKLVGASREAVEVGPNIFPRGSTFRLPDERVVLFVGGAKSVDWREREGGVDWFPEEILVPEDLPDELGKAKHCIGEFEGCCWMALGAAGFDHVRQVKNDAQGSTFGGRIKGIAFG